MVRFIAGRIGQSLVTLLAISVLVFALNQATGNPIDALLADDATEQQIEEVTRLWGLDRPYHEQYFTFIGNALSGNLGHSLQWRGQSVTDLVISRLPATLQLGALAMLISILVAIPLGVLSAVKRDTMLDFVGKIIAFLGQSIPIFWLAIVLMWIFAVILGWLPTSGSGGIMHMILPAVSMAWFQVAAMMRLTRSGMLDALDSEYVKFARAKGVSNSAVVWKHALRNALLAPLTYFGVVAGVLLTGSVVVESIFSYPGTGLLAIEAINGRDYPVVQGVVLLFAAIFILGNLIVDLLYAIVDPRIRY